MCYICKRIKYQVKERMMTLRKGQTWSSRTSQKKLQKLYPKGRLCKVQLKLISQAKARLKGGEKL